MYRVPIFNIIAFLFKNTLTQAWYFRVFQAFSASRIARAAYLEGKPATGTE